MIITTYNNEIFTVPDQNVLYFDAQTHVFIQKGTVKNYINKMLLKIKSDKNIQCNDVENDECIERGDMDFAERITKYNDIKTIEFNHCLYFLSWTYNGENFNENKEQKSFVKDNIVNIELERYKTN